MRDDKMRADLVAAWEWSEEVPLANGWYPVAEPGKSPRVSLVFVERPGEVYTEGENGELDSVFHGTMWGPRIEFPPPDAAQGTLGGSGE